MIRRVIRLLIVLGLAYGIYRLIDPVGAQELVANIQSYFDREKQEEVLVEENADDVVVTQEIPETNTAPIYTGTINTGSLVELDYVLSESLQKTWSESTGTVQDTTQQDTTPASTPTASQTTTTTKTTPSISSKSLSKQDEADMKAFLNAIVE